jgi:2,5-diketo-D-gluconate reductase A
LSLNSGTQLPQLGLGTYGLNGRPGTEAVIASTDIGYRLFDTAVAYGNESAVGAGVNTAGIPRDQLFVTTKFDGEFQGGRRALGGLDDSLRRMELDYVDLILGVELQARTSRPAVQGHRHRARRQPDPARPDARES